MVFLVLLVKFERETSSNEKALGFTVHSYRIFHNSKFIIFHFTQNYQAYKNGQGAIKRTFWGDFSRKKPAFPDYKELFNHVRVSCNANSHLLRID